MPYFALPNFKHDSGPNRIQSGPDHQGYTVLFSGVQSTGVDEGIVLYASPLSGTLLTKAWDFDSNWRYIPSTLPSQSISLDPTPYDASGVLDTYRAARIYTRDNVAGAQAASVIGPETGKITPRGGALQAGANVGRPETYMYYGGGAPDNQNYSPYNTPDANTAAEGKTGGGVTHRNYESSLLTNLLGSQGTSDRSQWRYHQPVYCKTFTETQRSAKPGLMSSTLRYIYRGSATSYAYNYGGELLASRGGFEVLEYESFDPATGCDLPLPPISSTGIVEAPATGDILSLAPPCPFQSVTWYNSNSTNPIGTGTSYTVQASDIGYKIYATVTYLDSSQVSSPFTGTSLPPIGSAFQGGYLGGLISHTADGNPTHALIVAPFGIGSTGTSYGGGSNLRYKINTTNDPYTASAYDGVVNTNFMILDGITKYPAANYCVSLNIAGYTDWYLPAILEMDILYFNLKPTTQSNTTGWGINPYAVPYRSATFTPSNPPQTSIAIFQAGGSQAWGTSAGPRSSTEAPNPANAWGFDWAAGGQFNNNKTFLGPVRAIRRITL